MDNIVRLEIYRKTSFSHTIEITDKKEKVKDTKESTDRISDPIPALRTRTSTQESFGFQEESQRTHQERYDLGLTDNFMPLDFKQNYTLIKNMKINTDTPSTYIFSDDINIEITDQALNIFYTILVFDDTGKSSKYSTVFSTTFFHYPEAPEITSCISDEDGVKLKWNPSSLIIDDIDYSSQLRYNIYSTDNLDFNDDPFLRPVNQTPLSSLEWTDKRSLDYQEYFYFIRSVLSAGGALYESLNSDICSVIIHPQKQLPPVEGLLSFIESDAVMLLWRPGPDKDIIGYNIYRRKSAQKDYELINESPLSSLRFQDKNLSPGIYYYYITAVYSTEPLIESPPSEKLEIIIGS